MRFFFQQERQKGFSLIEVMVATALFTIVVVIGIGALLSANNLNRRTDTARQAIDSVSFAMEDMARNLRLGVRYRCMTSMGPSTIVPDTPSDCNFGNHISFEGVQGAQGTPEDGDQIVYSIRPIGTPPVPTLVKSTTSGADFVALTTPEVVLDPTRSGFRVTGATKTDAGRQPRVTIRLVGSVEYQDVSYPFAVQTSVSQRVIDL